MDYGTLNWVLVYFNSVIKRVKQCCCALILLPKSTLNANLTTTNRFFTNDDWQRGRLENFASDHQYESNLESDVRFEIESNHEASQVPNCLSVHPSTKSYFDLNEIWCIGRGQWVIRDCMLYDLIKGHGHGGLKCAKMVDFKVSLLHQYAYNQKT